MLLPAAPDFAKLADKVDRAVINHRRDTLSHPYSQAIDVYRAQDRLRDDSCWLVWIDWANFPPVTGEVEKSHFNCCLRRIASINCNKSLVHSCPKVHHN